MQVGLALREQVLNAGDVPVGANDVQVDMIVTPDETITPSVPTSSLGIADAHALPIDSIPKSA